MRGVLLIFSLLALYSIFSVDAKEANKQVSMKGMKFSIPKLKIKLGETVEWKNEDSILHNVVIPDLKFRSKLIKKGQLIVFKPTKTGKFQYFCEPHKSMGMKAELEVVK